MRRISCSSWPRPITDVVVRRRRGRRRGRGRRLAPRLAFGRGRPDADVVPGRKIAPSAALRFGSSRAHPGGDAHLARIIKPGVELGQSCCATRRARASRRGRVWNCPGRRTTTSSFVVNRRHFRRGSRASPSRRSGRAPRAPPWRAARRCWSRASLGGPTRRFAPVAWEGFRSSDGAWRRAPRLFSSARTEAASFAPTSHRPRRDFALVCRQLARDLSACVNNTASTDSAGRM